MPRIAQLDSLTLELASGGTIKIKHTGEGISVAIYDYREDCVAEAWATLAELAPLKL
jgi:hypothetical protein